MGCNYKIYGSIMLRRSQDVEALLEALREQLDDAAVEVEELDENTIDLRLNFDDSTTVHTPAAMAELFEQMEPFVTGAGSFEIETSGERWTEYVGSREEVAKARSTAALYLIQVHLELLTPEDRAKLGVSGELLALRNALGALPGKHSASDGCGAKRPAARELGIQLAACPGSPERCSNHRNLP